MNNFSLLILCAGFGKRMLNLTSETPKPLLKFRNKTLLSNTINFFKNIGCNQLFINTHYLHDKIESYVNKKFNNYPIKLIFEPSILGTGGAVKNVFNYTKNKRICVVNSDIFWQKNNKIDVLNFLQDFNEVNYCKLLLSKKNNFIGLKKNRGDFYLQNYKVVNWNKGNELFFYSGLQIVSKNVFQNTTNIFPMNKVWKKLIVNKNINGSIINSNILHIGDKNSLQKL